MGARERGSQEAWEPESVGAWEPGALDLGMTVELHGLELLLVELLRRCSLAKFPPSGGDLSEGVMMALGLIGGCFSTFVAKLQNDSFLHSVFLRSLSLSGTSAIASSSAVETCLAQSSSFFSSSSENGSKTSRYP